MIRKHFGCKIQKADTRVGAEQYVRRHGVEHMRQCLLCVIEKEYCYYERRMNYEQCLVTQFAVGIYRRHVVVVAAHVKEVLYFFEQYVA